MAKIVYVRATASLKRALCLGGAKNHLLVLPDAHLEMTASNVVASMSGCAGQRCMAAAQMVGIGAVEPIIQQMIVEAKKLIPGKNLGPVISKVSDQRISASSRKRKLERDAARGRNPKVEGDKANGYYLGPTIIDHVTADMRISREEVFGPVISIIRAKGPGCGHRHREREPLRQRGCGLHAERRQRTPGHGTCQRRHLIRREHRRARSARTFQLRWPG